MIGTSIVIGNNAQDTNSDFLIKESWHKRLNVLSSDNIHLFYTYYSGYPITMWKYKENIIIYEGIIYNITEDKIKIDLNNISESQKEENILDFVKNADGEFCIFIYNEVTQSSIIFNDILGGLPLFFYSVGNKTLCSRSFSFIASNIKKRSWNSEVIAEYLTFQFNLKNKTFCDEIKKMEPASLITIVNGILCYKVLYTDSFDIIDRYKNRKEAAKDLALLFLDSCKSRVEYAVNHNYKIVNTISGGFDSRTILGGIEKYIKDYDNITYEYFQDESPTAKALLVSLESKSRYKKLQFDNVVNPHDSILAFNTGGRINAYTNSVCYNDMQEVHKEYGDEKVLYFGGFGGEYIRHPYMPTLVPFHLFGCAQYSSFFLTSKICKTSYKRMIDLFKKSFARKKDDTSYYKEFYNEYYQNLVRCSGEDRTRMFYYTVQPMMSKDFVMAIRHRLPLAWVGFDFYAEFLKCIDDRLLTVNIFGQKEGYLNHHNLVKEDYKRKVIHKYTHLLHYLLNRFFHWDYKQKESKILYSEIDKLLKCKSCQKLFDENFIENNYRCFGKGLQYTLLSILSLINEIEKK